MATNEESSAQGADADDDAPRDATTEATRATAAFLGGKGGKSLLSRAYPSKRPSMYGDESEASEESSEEGGC